MPAPDGRRTLRATIEYDGTAYAGWQRQPDRPTIQQVLEESLSDLTGERITCVASGRTDAGVHARGQVVSFRTRSAIPADGLLHGTNQRLPPDISVLSAADVAPDFHARRDAKGKHYRYRILNRGTPRALDVRTVWRVPEPLETGLMARAAAHLTGTHDFTSFRNLGSVEGDGVRTIARLDVRREGENIFFDVEGNGFLSRMVRNIVGTLFLVGRGSLGADRIPTILAARDRGAAGPAAPPQGLCLVEVFY